VNEDAARTLDALAAPVRSRVTLRGIVQTAPGEGLPARRVIAVREALIARGIAETRISTSVSEGVPDDHVVVLIEKTTASVPSSNP